MKAAVKVQTLFESVLKFAMMAGLTLSLIGAMALHARGEDATNPIETGSIQTDVVQRDVVVAPVRRVFPKTPTDRDLNRLSRTAKAKTRGASKKSTKR